MTTCTKCGASWDECGFYHSKGKLQQPCKECRKDTSSTYYYNNQLTILDALYEAYHAPDKHEAMKARFRDQRRKQRQQASA